MLSRHFHTIEEKEYKGLPLVSGPEDLFTLQLEDYGGSYKISVVDPWNGMLRIGEIFYSKEDAIKSMDDIADRLDRGYGIRQTSNHSAEIVSP